MLSPDEINSISKELMGHIDQRLPGLVEAEVIKRLNICLKILVPYEVEKRLSSRIHVMTDTIKAFREQTPPPLPEKWKNLEGL